jgi:hypothetical protein
MIVPAVVRGVEMIRAAGRPGCHATTCRRGFRVAR